MTPVPDPALASPAEPWVDDVPGHRPVWQDPDPTAMPGSLPWCGFWRCTCGRVTSTQLGTLRAHADWIREYGETPLCWACSRDEHERCHEYAKGLAAIGRVWGEELRRTWTAADAWGRNTPSGGWAGQPPCECPVVLTTRARPELLITTRRRQILGALAAGGRRWIASYGSTQHAELVPNDGTLGTTYGLMTDLFDAGLIDIGELEPIPGESRRGRPASITPAGRQALTDGGGR